MPISINYPEWIVAGVLAAVLLGLASSIISGLRLRDKLINLCFALVLDESFYDRTRSRLNHMIKTHAANDRATLYLVLVIELEEMARRVRSPAVASLMWKLKSAPQTEDILTTAEIPRGDTDQSTIGSFRMGVPTIASQNAESEYSEQLRYIKMAKAALSFKRFLRRIKTSLKPK
jgi:hypothetical protein